MRYAEIGYGNPTFLSTEIEYQNGTECRVPGFRISHITEIYLRVWIGKKVFVLSKSGVSVKFKSVRRFKIVLGFQGF